MSGLLLSTTSLSRREWPFLASLKAEQRLSLSPRITEKDLKYSFLYFLSQFFDISFVKEYVEMS